MWARCIAYVSLVMSAVTVWPATLSGGQPPQEDIDHQEMLGELNVYWDEVSRSVREGDFEGYKRTCHPQGVLVSGVNQRSYPLSDALERWKPGFEATRAQQQTASVEFRFSQRLHDGTTAHETGVFRYTVDEGSDNESIVYIRFEGLLLKTATGWQIIMEYQKSVTTEEEWLALPAR